MFYQENCEVHKTVDTYICKYNALNKIGYREKTDV